MIKLKLPPPNRVAAYLTTLAALCGALAPAVANLDLTGTVGVLGGVVAIVGVFREWLKGWRAHEFEAASCTAVPHEDDEDEAPFEPGDVLPSLLHLRTEHPSVAEDAGDIGTDAVAA